MMRILFSVIGEVVLIGGLVRAPGGVLGLFGALLAMARWTTSFGRGSTALTLCFNASTHMNCLKC
jgi:hypothetical protein